MVSRSQRSIVHCNNTQTSTMGDCRIIFHVDQSLCQAASTVAVADDSETRQIISRVFSADMTEEELKLLLFGGIGI